MFNEKGEAAVVSTRKGVGAHVFSGQDIERIKRVRINAEKVRSVAYCCHVAT